MKYFLKPELYAVKEEDGEYIYIDEADELSDTPKILSWQDIEWPVIGDDYGVYVMPAGQGELNELAPDGDGQTFLETWISKDIELDIQTVWDSLKIGFITTDNEVDLNWPALIHVFRSLGREEYLLIWDVL